MTNVEIELKLKDLLYEISIETIRSDSRRADLIRSFDEYFRVNGCLTFLQEKTLGDIYDEVMQ